MHEDKQTSISKADMLHINAHADVSKGLEPKQFSLHNPGQVVWDRNTGLLKHSPIAYAQNILSL